MTRERMKEKEIGGERMLGRWREDEWCKGE